MIRVLGLASLVLVGCIDDRDVQMPDEPDQAKVEVFEIPQVSPPPLDVLIVVDNSAAMAGVEANVVANLPAFGAFFEQNKGWWDRHIGVVTSDVGCPGRAPWRYDGLTNDQFFIDWRHLDHTRTKNFDGTLADHLPIAMGAGHDGCGAHRPLDAIIAALDPATRFRRTNADLIIFVIGASDDQSIVGVDEAVAQILARTDAPDPFRPRITTVAFAPEHAARLRAFATANSDQPIESFISIDSEDMVAELGWGFSHGDGWGLHCFESKHLDRDPAPGLQASCAVSDLVRDGETMRTTYEKALPACNGSNRPCWRAQAEPQGCTITPDYGSGYGLVIDRIDFPPMGTRVVGQCEILEIP